MDEIENETINKTRKIKEPVFYYAPGKKGKVIVTGSDIYQIAKIINTTIFNHFPSLENLYSYFTEFVRTMSKLDIPITWITPSGLKISYTNIIIEVYSQQL